MPKSSDESDPEDKKESSRSDPQAKRGRRNTGRRGSTEDPKARQRSSSKVPSELSELLDLMLRSSSMFLLLKSRRNFAVYSKLPTRRLLTWRISKWRMMPGSLTWSQRSLVILPTSLNSLNPKPRNLVWARKCKKLRLKLLLMVFLLLPFLWGPHLPTPPLIGRVDLMLSNVMPE